MRILCKLGDYIVNIYFQDVEPPTDQVCQVSLQWHQLSHFHLSECHLACYPSKVFICVVAGLPENKRTAADMYEKAALLGESGAEAEAKRLRKYISRLGMKVYHRNKFFVPTHYQHPRSLQLSLP